MVARVVRNLAVALVATWGVLGTLFVNAEVLSDPGGWKGVGLVVLWDVPLAGLVWLALRRPAVAARFLPVVLLVVGTLVIVDAVGELVDRDRWGPLGAVSLFVVAVPCGLLGVRRAGLAGLLLLTASAVTLVATVVGMDRAGGEPFRAALGGSTGVQVVPFLLFALLFLTADGLERAHEHGHVEHPPVGQS